MRKEYTLKIELDSSVISDVLSHLDEEDIIRSLDDVVRDTVKQYNKTDGVTAEISNIKNIQKKNNYENKQRKSYTTNKRITR